jgi:hypothetical protein
MHEKHQRLADAWRDLWGQYKAITDAFDGFLYIVSPEYEVEFVNQHLAHLLGRYPLGETCYRAIYSLDHPCPWCGHGHVMKGETVRRISTHPHDTLSSYRVSAPLFWQGELFMMVTVQNLSGDVVLQDSLHETEPQGACMPARRVA